MWQNLNDKIFLRLFVALNVARLGLLLPWVYPLFRLAAADRGMSLDIIYALVIAAIAANLALLVPRARAYAALLCWIFHAVLCWLNPLLTSPDSGLNGYLYLFIFLSGPLARERDLLFFATLFLTANSYFVAGVKKLQDPAWRAGNALSLIYERGYISPHARALYGFLDHAGALTVATYAVMAIYLMLPLALWRRDLFRALNGTLLANHVFILFTMNLKQVSAYYVLFHAFLFALAPRKREQGEGGRWHAFLPLKALARLLEIPGKSA